MTDADRRPTNRRPPRPAPVHDRIARSGLPEPAPLRPVGPLQAALPLPVGPRGGKGLVTIVVPAKNEAGAIADTLRSLPLKTLHLEGYATEVLVLDGNSRDGTPDIARSLGARVVPDARPGKGNGFRLARSQFRGDYVVMLDADGTYATDAIPSVLGPLAWGEADLVMGVRNALPGSMSGLHRAGNLLLSSAATALYARQCRDLCTGLWGFRAPVLHAMPLRSERFGLEAEFFALAARMRLRLRSVPVDYLPRRGTSNLSALRDGWRILRRLLLTRASRLPPAPAALPGLEPLPTPQEA